MPLVSLLLANFIHVGDSLLVEVVLVKNGSALTDVREENKHVAERHERATHKGHEEDHDNCEDMPARVNQRGAELDEGVVGVSVL